VTARLQSAILCDRAIIHDDLLYIWGGAITHLPRPSEDSPFGVTLAVMIEVDPDDRDTHEVAFFLSRLDTVDTSRTEQIGLAALQAYEAPKQGWPRIASLHFPLAGDLWGFGAYEIGIRIDGVPAQAVKFFVPPPE
jgi:hypothetical protein